jgi:hypothetical protein
MLLCTALAAGGRRSVFVNLSLAPANGSCAHLQYSLSRTQLGALEDGSLRRTQGAVEKHFTRDGKRQAPVHPSQTLQDAGQDPPSGRNEEDQTAIPAGRHHERI